ncbi:hypothetical protein [Helicobacter fennelliae]
MQHLLDTLQSAQTKQELKYVVLKAVEAVKLAHISEADFALYKLFCQNLRNRIFEIFQNGDILDSVFLYLGFIISRDLEEDSRFEVFVKLVDTMLKENVSDEEYVMLVELGAMARILKNPKNQIFAIDQNAIYSADDGLCFLISHIVFCDITSFSAQKTSQFITESFAIFHVDFGWLECALRFAMQSVDSALHRRNMLNWQLHVFWNIKLYFNTRAWLNLYEDWKKVFYAVLDSDNTQSIDEALYIQFFIYHMCGNSFTSQDQWRKFNDEISKKATIIYQDFAQKNHLLLPIFLPTFSNKKLKIIAILRDRIVENSPFKVEYSLIKNLINNHKFNQQYEIRIYTMSLIEKSENDLQVIKSLQDLGVSIFDVGEPFNKALYHNSHLQKALALRQKMQEDGVSVLISPNNGYGISDFLLSTRSAPIQVFYTHGNYVYDILGIDFRMTHICDNQRQITHQGYEFLGIPLKMDSLFYTPNVAQEVIDSERARFPKDKKLIGVIGRLTKIDSVRYLQVICKLLRENSHYVFLACGIGNEAEIKKKIIAIDSALLERFYFAGYVDSGVYGHIIDFWADSFPMEQGESRIEYIAKAKGLALRLSTESYLQWHKNMSQKLHNLKSTIQELESEIAISFNEYKELVLDFTQTIAFCEEDYYKKALNIMNLDYDNLKNLLNKQSKIFEVNAKIREKLGVEFFMDFLDSALCNRQKITLTQPTNISENHQEIDTK